MTTDRDSIQFEAIRTITWSVPDPKASLAMRRPFRIETDAYPPTAVPRSQLS